VAAVGLRWKSAGTGAIYRATACRECTHISIDKSSTPTLTAIIVDFMDSHSHAMDRYYFVVAHARRHEPDAPTRMDCRHEWELVLHYKGRLIPQVQQLLAELA